MDIITDNVTLLYGDCLERIKEIPDESIDMILTDPPYGTMSTIGQSGDLSHGLVGQTDWDVALDTKLLMKEALRVLKHRGAMVLFSQGAYTVELMTNTHGNLPLSYRMVWVKDHFGNALISKKAPVNMFEDICVFFKRAEDMKGHPLQSYFNDELARAGLTVKQIINKIGNGGVRHHFTTGKVFRVPSQDRYEALRAATGCFTMSYDDIKALDDWFKDSLSDDRVKIFNLPEGEKTKSNVMYYSKDPDSIHPTQKPVALCEDLIRTYTNEGATILDLTFGSCSTGVASVNTGRKFVGMELNDHWFGQGANRVLTTAP